MIKKTPKSKQEALEQLREHYVIEKELADKLRNANKEERRYLYATLYDELYRRVPYHPQLMRKVTPEVQNQEVSAQLMLLRRFLNAEITFLEVGPGDCKLAFEVAKRVKKVYAVDVSEEVTKSSSPPKNFELIISDGSSISVPDNSIDVAYSNQLMEHLHPDDALEQLHNIYKVLIVGGVYICVTPNRLTGPHDVSKYFDEVATGFHLKEYTTTELVSLFKVAGFSKTSVLIGVKGFTFPLPVFLVRWAESVLTRLPRSLSKKMSCRLPISLLLGIRLGAVK